MEYKKIYELKKSFGGYTPDKVVGMPAALMAFARGRVVGSEPEKEETFLKTKEQWQEIFKLTDSAFDSLVYLKIFEEIEFGIKVLIGDDYNEGIRFTILGISDLAPCGEIQEVIEKAIIEKYKNRIKTQP